MWGKLFGAGFLLGALLAGMQGVAWGAPLGDSAAATPRPAIDDELARGIGLIGASHFDEAITVFNDILARVPGFAPALANRAMAYAWTNRLEDAERDLNAAERSMPDTAIIHRVRALVAQRRSDDNTAIAEFSRSLELEPGNPLALRFRAYMYQRAGNEAAALADADAYIAARPLDPDGYAIKADLLIGQRQRAPAAAEAIRLVELFPDNSYALASAARIYDALADRDRAMALISAVIEREPDYYYYHLLRARFRRWDDFGGRRADLATALRLDPGNDDALAQLGLVDFQERKWTDAIARFSDVLEREPNDFGVLAYRAMARLNGGDRASAERDFQTGLAATSGADDLNLMCGAFAREGVALDWGLETCNRAITRDGTQSAYHANRGMIELRLGRLDAALADYDAAIAADARRADGYYGRALVRRRMGDAQGAAADRTEALAIDPGIPESYHQYGLDDFEPDSRRSVGSGASR